MNRRTFLNSLVSAGLLLTFSRQMLAQAGEKMMIETIEKDESTWKELLTPAQFEVLRKEGTERAFSSHLNKNYSEGTYVCAGCALPLFDSETKFDSGTGWPSFYVAIEGNTASKRDFKMFLPRTEYHCARCGGHQGHIFNDGPQPTGQRWCNNGVALNFVAKPTS
ncbi:MAG: peptide-methionine (R)-S-oxide reductase MsrB [Mariprofundaceae bacterium]|nr:peptide-methionine (R)-S-oxide reductase MsrB [Mariprofundaceae bacterium]